MSGIPGIWRTTLPFDPEKASEGRALLAQAGRRDIVTLITPERKAEIAERLRDRAQGPGVSPALKAWLEDCARDLETVHERHNPPHVITEQNIKQARTIIWHAMDTAEERTRRWQIGKAFEALRHDERCGAAVDELFLKTVDDTLFNEGPYAAFQALLEVKHCR